MSEEKLELTDIDAWAFRHKVNSDTRRRSIEQGVSPKKMHEPYMKHFVDAKTVVRMRRTFKIIPSGSPLVRRNRTI